MSKKKKDLKYWKKETKFWRAGALILCLLMLLLLLCWSDTIMRYEESKLQLSGLNYACGFVTESCNDLLKSCHTEIENKALTAPSYCGPCTIEEELKKGLTSNVPMKTMEFGFFDNIPKEGYLQQPSFGSDFVPTKIEMEVD